MLLTDANCNFPWYPSESQTPLTNSASLAHTYGAGKHKLPNITVAKVNELRDKISRNVFDLSKSMGYNVKGGS